MAWVARVVAELMIARELAIDEFEGGGVGISDGKLDQHLLSLTRASTRVSF